MGVLTFVIGLGDLQNFSLLNSFSVDKVFRNDYKIFSHCIELTKGILEGTERHLLLSISKTNSYEGYKNIYYINICNLFLKCQKREERPNKYCHLYWLVIAIKSFMG